MVTWRKTYPTAASKISDLPTLHSDNFCATQIAYEYEHNSPLSSNATCGTHKLGAVGVIYEGTTVQISNLTGMEAGALAYDTTLGMFVYYTGSAWQRVGQTKWSRMRAYLSSNVAVTADAAVAILTADTETYDTLGEYTAASGVFTALASGYYLINCNVALMASATYTNTKVQSATGNVAVAWTPLASTNWSQIDEYPVANDADYNYTATLNQIDIVSGAALAEAGSQYTVYVKWRGARGACVCNNACYGYSACSCDSACYSYAACTCDSTCYGQDCKSDMCDCFLTCYGYTCTCQSTCYGYSTCSCNSTCYGQGASKVTPQIRIGGTDYACPSDEQLLTTSWANYTGTWTVDPSDSAAWTAAKVNAIQGFGYKLTTQPTAVNAYISQAYLQLEGYRNRPIFSLMVYKNGNLVEGVYKPINEPGSVIYQNVQLLTILKLDASDQITICYQKTLENDTIYAGTGYTNLSIHRLGGNQV